DLTRDATSVWSLTYSPDGAHLLSSHVDQWESDSRVSRFPTPPEFELWAVGHSLDKPEGQLAKFQSPNWRWLPRENRFSPDGRFVLSTSSYGLLQWDIAHQRFDVKFAGRNVVLSPDCRTALCVPMQTAD